MGGFPEKIKPLRIAKGMSQAEVGGIVGVTRAAVQQWERGSTTPSLENALELARFFRVPFAEMMGAPPRDTSIDEELRILPEDTRSALQSAFLETIRRIKGTKKL